MSATRSVASASLPCNQPWSRYASILRIYAHYHSLVPISLSSVLIRSASSTAAVPSIILLTPESIAARAVLRSRIPPPR